MNDSHIAGGMTLRAKVPWPSSDIRAERERLVSGVGMGDGYLTFDGTGVSTLVGCDGEKGWVGFRFWRRAGCSREE